MEPVRSPSNPRQWIVYRDKIGGRTGPWLVAEEGREPVVDEFREKVAVVAVDELLALLEIAYHPQNPVPDHPRDFIERRLGRV